MLPSATMARRRRNKVVIWDWSPDGKHKEPKLDNRRKRSLGRDALGAAVLLGVIIFVLSWIPPSPDGHYRRDRLGRYMCELVGTNPGTLPCVTVAVGGWLVIVVTLGLILKIARRAVKSVGGARDDA
jgi:hypothetical protein